MGPEEDYSGIGLFHLRSDSAIAYSTRGDKL
jgi:hypothetical protein